MKFIYTLTVGVGIIVCSCSTTVNRTEFDRIYMSALTSTVGAVFYKGRDEDYDYFQAAWADGPTRFRIKAGQSPVIKPFPFSDDPEKWTCASSNQLNFSTPISDDDLKKLGILIKPEHDHPT